jgi:hypothetical protein
MDSGKRPKLPIVRTFSKSLCPKTGRNRLAGKEKEAASGKGRGGVSVSIR